jgi:hypothetical protein
MFSKESHSVQKKEAPLKPERRPIFLYEFKKFQQRLYNALLEVWFGQL